MMSCVGGIAEVDLCETTWVNRERVGEWGWRVEWKKDGCDWTYRWTCVMWKRVELKSMGELVVVEGGGSGRGESHPGGLFVR